MLCNAASANAPNLGHAVADILLAGALPNRLLADVQPGPTAAAKAGLYRSTRDHSVMTVTASNGTLRAGTRVLDPREFGLDLPAGTLAAGNQQPVTTTDDNGLAVVGRIHVRVGDAAVVLVPDGELVARREGQFTPTDRKFEPLEKRRADQAPDRGVSRFQDQIDEPLRLRL